MHLLLLLLLLLFRYDLAPSYDNIPEPYMNLFRSYDVNVDGTIDPYEFITIAHDLQLDAADSSMYPEVSRCD